MNSNIRKLFSFISENIFNFDKFFSKKNKCDKVNSLNIFIVGPPRSGSTMLYEYCISKYELDYTVNIEYFLYKNLYFALIVKKFFEKFFKHKFQYSSNQGFIAGLMGPSENSRFWEDYFSLSLNLNNKNQKLDKKYAIGYLNHRSIKIKKPMVHSWNAHIFYIDEIKKVFSNCAFLIIIRNPIEIASSILETRLRINKDIKIPWSYMPNECLKIKNPVEQAALQSVLFLKYSLLLHASDERSVLISYENFCENYETIIKRAFKILDINNIIIPRNEAKSEGIFIKKNKKKLYYDELKKFVEYYLIKYEISLIDLNKLIS